MCSTEQIIQREVLRTLQILPSFFGVNRFRLTKLKEAETNREIERVEAKTSCLILAQLTYLVQLVIQYLAVIKNSDDIGRSYLSFDCENQRTDLQLPEAGYLIQETITVHYVANLLQCSAQLQKNVPLTIYPIQTFCFDRGLIIWRPPNFKTVKITLFSFFI